MVVVGGVVSAGKGVSSSKETEAVVSISKVDQQHIRVTRNNGRLPESLSALND